MIDNYNKLFFIVIGIALLFLANCSSNKSLSDVRDKFEVEFGRGGGFTGDWNGFSIKNNGNYYSLACRISKRDSTFLGKLDDKDLEILWSEINKIEFFQINYKKHGNITYSIEVKADKQSNSVSWEDSAKDSTTIKLSNLYNRLKKMCIND